MLRIQQNQCVVLGHTKFILCFTDEWSENKQSKNMTDKRGKSKTDKRSKNETRQAGIKIRYQSRFSSSGVLRKIMNSCKEL